MLIEVLSKFLLIIVLTLGVYFNFAIFAYKRRDVSVFDIYIFFFKHGPLWVFTAPELYFDKKHAQFVRILHAIFLMAGFALMGLFALNDKLTE